AFLDVPIVEGTVMPQRKEDKLDPQTVQQYLDQSAFKVKGIRSSQLNFSMLLASHGQPITGSSTPPTTAQWALRGLLDTIMGGTTAETPASAALVLTSTAANAYTVNLPTNHNLVVGGAIACTLPNGRVEAREIKTSTT